LIPFALPCDVVVRTNRSVCRLSVCRLSCRSLSFSCLSFVACLCRCIPCIPTVPFLELEPSCCSTGHLEGWVLPVAHGTVSSWILYRKAHRSSMSIHPSIHPPPHPYAPQPTSSRGILSTAGIHCATTISLHLTCESICLPSSSHAVPTPPRSFQ
jgi:hypothetical protein